MVESIELDYQLLTFALRTQSWKLKNSQKTESKLASSHGAKGKELPKIPVGMEVLYEFNP